MIQIEDMPQESNNGRKQLFSLLLLVIFFIIFSFFKAKIKETKDRKSYMIEKKEIARQNELMHEIKKEEQRKIFLEQFLEYSDKCYLIHTFLIGFENELKQKIIQ